jgi:pimeloyl-ACP methyl ester carboxylesterase
VLPSLLSRSYLDCFECFSSLLRDPVYYGQGIRQGSGEPVLLIPGFFVGDWMMATMARWLTRIGYRAHLSGIDWNVGCPGRKVELLSWRVQRIARDSGVPVVLVGHSLGGMLARSIAVRHPDSVRHLVMLGAPSRMEWPAAIRPEWWPALRFTRSLWSMLGVDEMRCGTRRCECAFALSSVAPAGSVGFSSIYTRSDEVIEWRACLDSRAWNHEVPGGHFSLPVNRHVYRLLAETLVDKHTIRESSSSGVVPAVTPTCESSAHPEQHPGG